MNILVTGAAGYVGSVVTEELGEQGHQVIALDNLSQGHRQAIADEAIFIHGDFGDAQLLEQIFSNYPIDAVMHFGAETVVNFSITEPRRYFETNLIKSINLVNSMLDHEVHKLVFSSSAAVYGNPQSVPVRETDPQLPVNTYGESKLMFEKVLRWYGQAYNLKSISLRYFNAAGASHRFGEDHHPETSLIPNVLKVALGQSGYLPIFGNDYPTKDGTCTRDYIHVLDLAQAHILALSHLTDMDIAETYNLGNGSGYSVLEVVEVARKVTGREIPCKVAPRRQGDPAVLVASSELARQRLGWQPKYPDLETIIDSAWQWMKRHPKGYEKMI